MGRKAYTLNKKAGENIKQLLKDNHWTQVRLAEELHITPQTLSHQLNGDCGIPQETYNIIAGLFPGTRLSWIMGIDDCRTDEESAAKLAKDSYDRTVAPVEALFILSKAFDLEFLSIPNEDGSEDEGRDFYITYRQRKLGSITHHQFLRIVDDFAYYTQCRILKEITTSFPDKWTSMQNLMLKMEMAEYRERQKKEKENGKRNTKGHQ